MPSQGNPTRIKTALDTEVCNKVIELERDFYRYVDVALPKKHKYTLVAACVNGLLTVRRLIVKGMDYDVNYYARDKHRILTDARAELRNVAVDIQHLNDLGDVSNEARRTSTCCRMVSSFISENCLTRYPSVWTLRARAVEVRRHGTLVD